MVGCLTQAFSTELASASMLANAALGAIQASAHLDQKKGRLSVVNLMCIRSLDVAELIPVFENAILDNWNASEVAEIETFLDTSAGKKFARIAVLRSVERAGGEPHEKKPELTRAEAAALRKFSATEAGNRLTMRNRFDRLKSGEEIKAKVIEMIGTCGAVPMYPWN